MDCNAGAAIGQMMMRGGAGLGMGPQDMMHHDHDALMHEGMMEHGGEEWASQFPMHHHHHQDPHAAAMMAAEEEHMMAAEFDAMMREEAAAANAVPQSEDQAYEEAFHGDDWMEQFAHQEGETEGEQWAQDYNDEDVQVFTVEGEPLRTVEEKTKDSQFYGLLEKIRTKELVIDEEQGEIVAGPGPQAAEAEWQEQFSAMQQEAALRGEEDTDDWADQQEATGVEDDAYKQAWGSDEADEDYAERYLRGADGIEDNADHWLEEYEEMTSNLRKAQESTDYPFEPNNPYLFHDDPFTEGLELQQAGTLAEAVLAFEAACQKDMNRQEAWRQLGTAQAENEKDQLAIRALNKARELNPKDLSVHAALAVSHTNETNHSQALQALRGWLLAHAEYEHLGTINLHQEGDPEMADADDYSSQYLFVSPSEHRDCYTLFQAAVEMNPTDSELHSCLGVLKNLSHEFDEAAVHFNDALKFCPNDPKLWNKLGATLANGNRSREALDAYDRALDLNPGYVRAQYNLGIAHSNLGEHQMAAKHLLRAIVMQQGGVTTADGGGSGRSTREMWDVLRMTLNLMDRSDLVEMTWKQDVVPFLPEFGLEDLM